MEAIRCSNFFPLLIIIFRLQTAPSSLDFSFNTLFKIFILEFYVFFDRFVDTFIIYWFIEQF